jgi:hypothetical protein
VIRTRPADAPATTIALTATTLSLCLVLLIVTPGVAQRAIVCVPLGFLALGALISVRQLGNAEGLLLQLIGLSWAVILLLPFDGGWVVPVGLMGSHLLLRFPDGQLPSPRWRPVSWLATAVVVVLPVLVTTASKVSDSTTPPGGSNPYYVAWTEPLAAFILLLPTVMLISAASLWVRYRRADDVQRHQIRWLVYAGAIVVGWYVLVFAVSLLYDTLVGLDSSQSSWFGSGYPAWLLAMQLLALVSFLFIPAAFAVGILRYRLYDIDRLISRTLSYAIVSLLVLATYAGVVLAASRVVAVDSTLVTAGATLTAAALVRPALRRVQGAVDRRFNRDRFDAQASVELFGARLRTEVDLDQVEALLLATVDRTLQPTTLRLLGMESR